MTQSSKVPDAPPSGPPWDLPVLETPFAFVDLEMTGLDVTQDRVVEVCIERWVGETKVAGLSSLVLPDTRVGGAAHVHGLDAAALEGAPAFATLVPQIDALLEGAVLVAHAARWDVAFLEAELARAGQPRTLPFYVDSLVLARRAFAFRSYSLAALIGELGVPRGRSHRAEDDVAALRAIFARALVHLAPVSARDLWQVRVAQGKAREAILLACDAAVEHTAQVDVTYRASRGPAETFAMVLTEVRRDLDLPRVMGYQLPGRGRRELRADRILRVVPSAL